jgi:hypothetical protein
MTDTLKEAPPLVADGSLYELETPALLRRIAGVPAPSDAAGQVTLEASVLHPEIVPNDFVLVDFEVRPGVRNYRLVRPPKNDPWRIRIGAYERRVHRTFVVLARRIARRLAGPAAGVQVARPPKERLPACCVRV